MNTHKPLIQILARFVLLPILAVGCVGDSMVAATSEGTTVVVGCSRIDLPAGGRVVTPVFVKSSVYTGNGIVSGKTIGAAGLTPNALQPTTFADRPNYPTHYLEITSGTYAGYSYDVSSNSSGSVTLYDFPAELNAQTVSLTIRPHITLGDIAAGVSGLVDYADILTLYKSGNRQSSYYYIYPGFVGDDYSTPADHVVVYPGTAVLFNNGGPANITLNGQVKTTPTVVPIYSGVSLVGPLDPQGGAPLTSMNLAAVMEPYSGVGSILSTTGNLTGGSFYSDGISPLDENYEPFSSATAPLLSIGNGFLVNSGGDSFWKYFPPF